VAAAELAGHGHAEQAQLAEPGPQVLRERVLLVDPRRARRDLGLGEPPHRLAQRIDLLAKRKRPHSMLPDGLFHMLLLCRAGPAAPADDPARRPLQSPRST